jgi:hypothetical protein
MRTRRRQKIRTIHLWTALFCLPFLAVYAVTAVQMAHRTWFSNAGLMGALNRMHRMQGLWRAFPWIAAVGFVSLGLLALGATGLWLWFQNHRERWIGGALLASGIALAATLIVSMRAG